MKDFEYLFEAVYETVEFAQRIYDQYIDMLRKNIKNFDVVFNKQQLSTY
jgi:hypothetical protein